MNSKAQALSSGVERLPIGDDALLLIAPVGELEELEHGATEQELLSIKGISSPRRRAERLSWRRALRKGIGEGPDKGPDKGPSEGASEEASEVPSGAVVIEYDQHGAPIIKNSQYKHISVSHCCDRVAVLLSARECGVDIECRDRRFSAIAERYLTEEEYLVASKANFDRQTFLALAWSTKEALYKMLRREGVDLCRDLRIVAISPKQQSIVAEAYGEPVELRYILDCGHQIVYAIKKEDHNIE
ncbi:MAG: 4'-phosphopantetheinyl transferase superfamily protein [Alistipes sp.]|nr:4'-phosphopantetheinyl transferase superfamily protein [Alistipes sp.]